MAPRKTNAQLAADNDALLAQIAKLEEAAKAREERIGALNEHADSLSAECDRLRDVVAAAKTDRAESGAELLGKLTTSTGILALASTALLDEKWQASNTPHSRWAVDFHGEKAEWLSRRGTFKRRIETLEDGTIRVHCGPVNEARLVMGIGLKMVNQEELACTVQCVAITSSGARAKDKTRTGQVGIFPLDDGAALAIRANGSELPVFVERDEDGRDLAIRIPLV